MNGITTGTIITAIIELVIIISIVYAANKLDQVYHELKSLHNDVLNKKNNFHEQ